MAMNEYARIGHTSPEKSQANWTYLIRKYLPNLEKMRILDVGAGKGTLVRDISNNISNSVVGLDSSQAFKSSEGEFLQGDCHHLPFRDGAFDLVISIGMLEQVDDYEAAILEMKRVSAKHMFLVLGPTQFWKYLDNPNHNAIVIKNPSTLKVLSLLSDGEVLKVWGENVSYRLLQMPDWKLQFGPMWLQYIYKNRIMKILLVHILSLLEMVNLEQNICLIYSKKWPGVKSIEPPSE